MDVLGLIFASYIDAVSNNVYNRFTDMYGVDVQAQTVEYNNFRISYSYQLWRIQPKSVCSTYEGDLNTMSKCTISAKQMFNEMCMYLQNKPSNGWKYTKFKNMYCSAAINYKPVIANVTFGAKSEAQKAKEACSLATLRVMQSASSANLSAKEAAWGKR